MPTYKPVHIIKPPSVNEIIFSVVSEKRIDAFRLVVDDPKTKNNRLVHLWANSFE
jgi:hypothetical protein